jgi:DNA mismatch repair protein MutS
MVKKFRLSMVAMQLKKVMGAQEYVPTIEFDAETMIQLITGPNMSGNRPIWELALTVVMTQIGSFVPAEQVQLPILMPFSPESADDLISGQSTFMVEMMEANHAILADEKLTDLFDELGRGTGDL